MQSRHIKAWLCGFSLGLQRVSACPSYGELLRGEDDLCLQQIGQRKQPILLVYFKQMYNCCNDMLSMCFSRSDLILQEISRIYFESRVCCRGPCRAPVFLPSSVLARAGRTSLGLFSSVQLVWSSVSVEIIACIT